MRQNRLLAQAVLINKTYIDKFRKIRQYNDKLNNNKILLFRPDII